MASESKDTAKEGSNVYHPKDSEEFEKYIALGDYTLVDFSTSWCGVRPFFCPLQAHAADKSSASVATCGA